MSAKDEGFRRRFAFGARKTAAPSKGDAQRCGKRGAQRRSTALTWRIEGELVTSQQAADRLGIAVRTFNKRIKRSQREDGPVTWDVLRLPAGR